MRESERRRAHERVQDTIVGVWRAQTVRAAVELGVFALLAETPRGAADVAAACRLSEPAATVLMCACEAIGFLQRRDALWSCQADLARLLDRDACPALSGLLEAAAGDRAAVQRLCSALRGEPPTGGSGHASAQEGCTERLQEGCIERLAAHYAPDLAPLIDVAPCGDADAAPPSAACLLDLTRTAGAYGLALAQRNAELHADIVEVPAAAPALQAATAAIGLGARVRVLGSSGPLHLPRPARYDAIILGPVLHTCDAPLARRILGGCVARLAEGGELYVVDLLLDDTSLAPSFVALLAVQNLAAHPGARTWRISEMHAMLRELGFERRLQLVPVPPSPVSLVAYRRPSSRG